VKAVAYVTAVVLIVIGVGVVTVGGLTPLLGPARSYGEYPMHFTVAFPTSDSGQVRIVQIPPANPAYVSYSLSDQDDQAVVIGAREDTTLGPKLLNWRLAPDVKGFLTHTTSADGTTTTLGDPACFNVSEAYPQGVCADIEIVRSGNVTWLVYAGGDVGTPTLAQDFVASFHPAASVTASSTG
jgi:hypothetical protein